MNKFRNFLHKIPADLKEVHRIKDHLFKSWGIDLVCNFLHKHHITPNHISIFNITIVFSAFLILYQNNFLASLLLAINIAIDGLDGYYARNYHLESKLGEKLDHFQDFIVWLLIMIKTALHFQELWMIIPIVFFTVEMISDRAYKWAEYRFPSRLGIYFMVFGLHYFAMIAQAIEQPISFVLWYFIGKKKQYNQPSGGVA